MENYEGRFGAITVSVLKYGLKPTTTVQLVVSRLSSFDLSIDANQNHQQAVVDIGGVAAAVFRVNFLVHNNRVS